MKITKYNQRGEILCESVYNSTPSKYIDTTWRDHSPSSLCDTTEVLIHRPKTLSDFISLEQFKIFQKYHYLNYIRSGIYSPEIFFSQDFITCPTKYDEIAESISACISKYHKIYQPHDAELDKSRNQALQEDLIEALSQDSWIEGLFCHAIIISANKGIVENRTIAKSLLSIIHKYYYVLINQPNLNETLLRQTIILMPFANLRANGVCHNSILDNDSFTIKCYRSLYTNYSEVFKLASTLDYLHLGMAGFAVKQNTSLSSVTLSAPTTSYTISLTEVDLAVLIGVEEDNGNIRKEIQALFSEIYNKYLITKENNWRQILRNRVGLEESFTDKQSKVICASLYLQELKDIETNCKIQKDKYQPQICFHDILFQHTDISNPHELSFTHNIIADIVCTLRHNGCTNQEGLYEKMFILNYLLSNADIETLRYIKNIKLEKDKKIAIESTLSIDKALDFLEDIFSKDYINTDILSVTETRTLFKNILYNKEFINQIRKERPKVRDKEPIGFNRGLIYNIIGVLRDLGVHKGISRKPLFRGNSADIDKTLMHDFADSNCARFISQYTPCERSNFKSPFQLPDGLEKIILEEFTTLRNSHKSLQ